MDMKKWFVENSARIMMTIVITFIVASISVLITCMVNSIKTFEPIP